MLFYNFGTESSGCYRNTDQGMIRKTVFNIEFLFNPWYFTKKNSSALLDTAHAMSKVIDGHPSLSRISKAFLIVSSSETPILQQ